LQSFDFQSFSDLSQMSIGPDVSIALIVGLTLPGDTDKAQF
jgi:hypothetical protein